MKKLILAIAFLVSTLAFSQETERNLPYYVATGVSITNSNDFTNSSYVSVEGGVNVDNVAFGAVFGRNNLDGTFGENESLNNYWYEGKIAVYQQVGVVDAYGLVGVGSYIENGNLFLEYGVGVSKSFDNSVGVFVQVSNWDGTTYTTPGLFYSF